MMGQEGMNIGDISALVNSLLIDFKSNKVGFKREYAWPSSIRR